MRRYMPVTQKLGRLRQEDCCELSAILGYIVSQSPVKVCSVILSQKTKTTTKQSNNGNKEILQISRT